MIERTRGQIIIVADHSKWGVVSNFQIATIEEINKFVSDEGLDASANASLGAHSVECVITAVNPFNA
jgi:DeoR/GlpR family transcriptional regulator of sugar metabolism